MSVHVRSLLLAIAAVLLPAQSVSACGGCLLLSPFRWLFGCDQYCGCPLATPHNCNRFIDDWFGYGYLRNQQGTLGHYPGNWYRQGHAWHGRRFQPYPAMTGGYGMPAPVIMPQPLPNAPIYNPSWNPCWDPCGGMAPQTPVVMQPPMTYPQPQWTAPVPVMAGPVWTSGECCDPCGGSSTVMYNAPAPAYMMHEGSSGSDCGCSGGQSGSFGMPPAIPPAGMLPQQPVSWQTGGWSNSGWQAVSANPGGNFAYGAPQPAPWTPNTVWQQHQSTHVTAVAAAYGQTWAAPPGTTWTSPQPYAQMQYAQPQYAQYPHTQPQYAQPQYAQPQYAQYPYTQPQYAQPQYAQQFAAASYAAPLPMVTPPSPVSMGSARLPIRRVSLASPPLGTSGARSYPHALR
ncbi:MAG: hypothetical protein ACKO2L_04785 [Planctomycetaceae bacterium]